MKLFKKLFCLALIIPVMFLFSACGKNNSSGKGSGGKGSDDTGANAPASNITETSQILGIAYDDFVKNATHEVENTSPLATKTESGYLYKSYDEFVLAGFSVFKVLSEYENLPENVWCYSDEVSVEGKTDYANRLLKFYVTSEDLEGNVDIKIYMMFGIEGEDIEEKENTYNFMFFNVTYYEAVGRTKVNIMVEKSRNNLIYDINDSTAEYYFISYTNWELLATSFTRAWEIDDIDNIDEITNRLITEYSFLRYFMAYNEVQYQTEGFSLATSAMKEDVQAKIKSIMNVFSVVNSNNAVAETKIEGLMEKLVKVVNAEHISDFEQ